MLLRKDHSFFFKFYMFVLHYHENFILISVQHWGTLFDFPSFSVVWNEIFYEIKIMFAKSKSKQFWVFIYGTNVLKKTYLSLKISPYLLITSSKFTEKAEVSYGEKGFFCFTSGKSRSEKLHFLFHHIWLK